MLSFLYFDSSNDPLFLPLVVFVPCSLPSRNSKINITYTCNDAEPCISLRESRRPRLTVCCVILVLPVVIVVDLFLEKCKFLIRVDFVYGKKRFRKCLNCHFLMLG